MSEETQDKIGKLLDESQKRDAVHFAVAPVMAAGPIHPGEPIGFAEEGNVELVSREGKYKKIGIADPFLKGPLKNGDRFFMFLYPNTVNGMRHDWSHPAFEAAQVHAVTEALTGESKKKAEQWLRNFARRWKFNYSDLIAMALQTNEENDWRYVTANGRDLHSRSELGNDYEEFWRKIEILYGKKFDEEHKDGLKWSCSC